MIANDFPIAAGTTNIPLQAGKHLQYVQADATVTAIHYVNCNSSASVRILASGTQAQLYEPWIVSAGDTLQITAAAATTLHVLYNDE